MHVEEQQPLILRAKLLRNVYDYGVFPITEVVGVRIDLSTVYRFKNHLSHARSSLRRLVSEKAVAHKGLFGRLAGIDLLRAFEQFGLKAIPVK